MNPFNKKAMSKQFDERYWEEFNQFILDCIYAVDEVTKVTIIALMKEAYMRGLSDGQAQKIYQIAV